MSVGWVIAFVVMLLCIIALFFSQAMPPWANVALLGALALAIVLSPLSVKWPWSA